MVRGGGAGGYNPSKEEVHWEDIKIRFLLVVLGVCKLQAGLLLLPPDLTYTPNGAAREGHMNKGEGTGRRPQEGSNGLLLSSAGEAQSQM
jgi:hypothetical protein